MGIVHYLALQARRPTGPIGWLIGKLFVGGNRQANDFAFDSLEAEAEHHILEIGFGPGAAIERMASVATAGKIVGVDFSETMLKTAAARNRYLIESGLVELHLGDVRELNFDADSFDRIVSVNVIYFWEDPRGVLRELHRVLKPGGRIVFYVTDRDSLSKMKITGTGVFTLYDSETGISLLKEGGFVNAHSRQQDCKDHVGICLIGEKT